MSINKNNFLALKKELGSKVILVAVSKTKPLADIKELYALGQRDFGENYVQELVEKSEVLPKDIRWHFIGHLQSNKVKYIAHFVHLIHGVDSEKLLSAINKQGEKLNKTISCLLQVHIAEEETKFGFDENELKDLISRIENKSYELTNVKITGLMGMGSFTDDKNKVRQEFHFLKKLFDEGSILSTNNYQLSTLSMGMSGDYNVAIEEGSNMVRIGSLLFGERN